MKLRKALTVKKQASATIITVMDASLNKSIKKVLFINVFAVKMSPSVKAVSIQENISSTHLLSNPQTKKSGSSAKIEKQKRNLMLIKDF